MCDASDGPRRRPVCVPVRVLASVCGGSTRRHEGTKLPFAPWRLCVRPRHTSACWIGRLAWSCQESRTATPADVPNVLERLGLNVPQWTGLAGDVGRLFFLSSGHSLAPNSPAHVRHRSRREACRCSASVRRSWRWRPESRQGNGWQGNVIVFIGRSRVVRRFQPHRLRPRVGIRGQEDRAPAES
jgi:hypothetical protein